MDTNDLARELAVSRRTVERWERDGRVVPRSQTPSARCRTSVQNVESLKTCHGEPPRSNSPTHAPPTPPPPDRDDGRSGVVAYHCARDMLLIDAQAIGTSTQCA